MPAKITDKGLLKHVGEEKANAIIDTPEGRKNLVGKLGKDEGGFWIFCDNEPTYLVKGKTRVGLLTNYASHLRDKVGSENYLGFYDYI